MNPPIDKVIRRIGDDPCFKAHLIKNYTREWEWWYRFSSRNGEQCPFARTAIKEIYLTAIKNNDTTVTQ